MEEPAEKMRLRDVLVAISRLSGLSPIDSALVKVWDPGWLVGVIFESTKALYSSHTGEAWEELQRNMMVVAHIEVPASLEGSTSARPIE